MSDATFLDWPFFEDRHRKLARALDEWAGREIPALVENADTDVDSACRNLVRALGRDGWLRVCVPAPYGGVADELDVRALCLSREILARHHALADFAFAMQGLGSGAISLFGEATAREAYLPAVARGEKIAAFALSEENAGSDAGAMTASYTAAGGGFSLNGEKTFISNGGIADFYTVFARSADAPKTISAFLVDASSPGFSVSERIETIAPHPLARLDFKNCAGALLGAEGEGFRIALSVLDIFRSTVGAAALGLARRALDEATRRAASRQMFGATLSDQPIAQAMLAEMALDVDAAALLVYRAAWTKDVQKKRVTREAAMAKLFATERAQSVIDKAVQLFGGLGVVRGVKVEELYRDIRALRIYEGASEVQKIIIARQHLEGSRG
jgi:acyl-CoA dehydrogenase